MTPDGHHGARAAPGRRSATSATPSSAAHADARLIDEVATPSRASTAGLGPAPCATRGEHPSAGPASRSTAAGPDRSATTSARSPAARRRGASTSRSTATATRSRPPHAALRARGRARPRHGGIVAALFDDVFGFVLDVVQEAAFTGELTIRYEAPTPLYRPIACRGRLARRDGRKLHIEGELVDTETAPVATAKATFIAVDPDVFARATAATGTARRRLLTAPHDQVPRVEAPARSGAHRAVRAIRSLGRRSTCSRGPPGSPRRSSRGRSVTAVDIARYSEVFARTWIEADADHVDAPNCGARRPEALPGARVRDRHVLRAVAFFQPFNGERIDAIRDAIARDHAGSRSSRSC